ncbi:MAG: hypothetical protein AAF749_00575, partial [Pseudomonadota bacterium]
MSRFYSRLDRRYTVFFSPLMLALVLVLLSAPQAGKVLAQNTAKPILHGRHWAAITGKPLAA